MFLPPSIFLDISLFLTFVKNIKDKSILKQIQIKVDYKKYNGFNIHRERKYKKYSINENIINYCIERRYLEQFRILVENGLQTDICQYNEPLIFLVYNKINKNELSSDFLIVLFENKSSLKMLKSIKKKCAVCDNPSCQYNKTKEYEFMEYFIKIQSMKDFTDFEKYFRIIRKNYKMEEYDFISALLYSNNIDVIVLMFEYIKDSLTKEVLPYIDKYFSNKQSVGYTEIKNEFIMCVYNNIDKIVNECEICYGNPKAKSNVLKEIYPDYDGQIYPCNHEVKMCLACIEKLKMKKCPFCRTKSNLVKIEDFQNESEPEFSREEILDHLNYILDQID